MSRAGDELLELLWDSHGPALRPTPFQPFTCSAAGSTRAHELHRGKRHHAAMDDDDDAVPWLHCPVIDDGDSDTAPLPPDFCAGLLPAAVPADPTPPDIAPPLPGEGVMNFTFFSRPLQRPPQPSSNPVESTVVQTAASRLRSTPLFSEQRMAWLQPPPRATPAGPQAPPPATDHHHHSHHVELEAAAAATVTQQQQQPQHRLQQAQPDARTAAAAVTTSSVCSGNGDRSHSHQARRSSHHQQQLAAECSVSQDEDMDDEPAGAARRSAARGTKRSRTAEVHNLSERRRRDRINEKMRALQELIPNCNKVDKASMLEEAIEYLKTLQLQVQMMSMGTAGLCMPPAMLMQMQVPTPMAPFPHLGMGLGFGMGPAFDMLPRFAAAVMPGAPPMAMPHGAMFGMPGAQVVPPPFPHVSNGAAPPEQREAAAAGPVPPPGGAASDQHPKQT